MLNYSLFNLIHQYNANKSTIESYSMGKDNVSKQIMGMGVAVFMFLLVLSLVFFIWGLIVLIRYFPDLPDWAKVVGILGLLMGLPIVTVIVVYASK